MIVAAHQPAFLPWLGYLEKVARADVFVIVDDVQYKPQNFQNRNRVKVNNGIAWLTVPLVHTGRDEPICAKRIARSKPNRHCWRHRAWRTLCVHYGRSPHFRRYAPALEAVFSCPWEDLVALDLHLLALLLGWFDITRTIVRSSTLGTFGPKTERILALCQRLGADTYLSGSGASRHYLDQAGMERAGVRVLWQDFRHPIHPQRYPALGFIPGLSAVDLLFNCGPASRAILLGEERTPQLERAAAMAQGGG